MILGEGEDGGGGAHQGLVPCGAATQVALIGAVVSGDCYSFSCLASLLCHFNHGGEAFRGVRF